MTTRHTYPRHASFDLSAADDLPMSQADRDEVAARHLTWLRERRHTEMRYARTTPQGSGMKFARKIHAQIIALRWPDGLKRLPTAPDWFPTEKEQAEFNAAFDSVHGKRASNDDRPYPDDVGFGPGGRPL